jgi:biotin carboxyl carrier protein
MSELIPSANRGANSDSDSSQLPARPVDILRIERELAEIAEAKGEASSVVERLLQYLLRLTNGRGALFCQMVQGQPGAVQSVWGDVSETEREALLQQMLKGSDEVLEKGATVIRALAGPGALFCLASPLAQEGRVRGMVALVLSARNTQELQPYVVILQTLLGFFHYALLRHDTLEGRWVIDNSAALVELTTLAAAAPYYEEAVRIMTGELQTHLGCYRVALGEVRGRQVRLVSISGVAQFDKRGTAALVIEGAMRETVLRGDQVQWPRAGGGVSGADLHDVAHQELRRLLDLDRVVSIPLRVSGEKVGAVLTLMWNQDHQPTASVDRFLGAAEGYLGAWLGTLRRGDPMNSRKWVNHLWTRLSQRKRGLLIGATIGLGLLLAWPMPNQLRVDCVVEPSVRRVVSAPFDGVLQKSHVEPGQTVVRGDLLAVMDDKELQWKHAELLASRDRALRQRDMSMTDSEAQVAQAQMAQLEAESLNLEIKLIEYKKENLELRSPMDGLILVGDLQRAEGAPVRQGQVLFEVAPPGNMLIELLIPARDISQIREGAETTVRLESFPGQQWYGKVQKIQPQAEVRDGENLFRAKVRMAGQENEVTWRAGMKGRAVVTGEHAPLIWLLTRRLWDFIHVTLFW